MKLRIIKSPLDSLWYLQRKYFFGWRNLAWRTNREELEEMVKKYSKNKYEYYREWNVPN